MATKSKDPPSHTLRRSPSGAVAGRGEEGEKGELSYEPLWKTQKSQLPVTANSFRTFLRTAAFTERIRIERDGVPSEVVQSLIEEMGIDESELSRYMRIPKATFTKKLKGKSMFAGTTGHCVVGLLEIMNKVEDMLAAEQHNGEACVFNVERWVGRWIRRPQPALGGLPPTDLMDTPSGRERVLKVLGALQSGSYQ